MLFWLRQVHGKPLLGMGSYASPKLTNIEKLFTIPPINKTNIMM